MAALKGGPSDLPRYGEPAATGFWKWLGPIGYRRWWSRVTLLACTAAIVLVWPIPIFMQMQRGVWLMPPPHGGFLHQSYGPMHGRYLHGLMADGTSCERFVPDSCYFIPGQKQPWQPPIPEAPVNFDVGEVLGECPFPAGGLYMDQPGPWCLAPPPKFWRPPVRERPTCGSGACCVRDVLQGDFTVDKATGQYELVESEAMGCKYHEFSRQDVFSCFHKRSDNAAIVMIGDSMTRQLFARAVGLFRGYKHAFDFGFHNSARYDVCANARAGADRFIVAPAPIGQYPFNYSGALELDELFSETEYLGPSPLDFCASQPLAIKYVWAITFEWQAYHLLKYLNTHDVSDSVITMMIGYHDRRHQVPPDYWAAIDAAANLAKRVVVFTVPTSIVGEPLREQQGLWQQRNKEIRDWVGARRDNKVALVDFDKLAWMDNSPPGTFGHNWHYQCTLRFTVPEGNQTVLEAREKEHRFITPTGWALHEVSVNEGKADCVDDMNRVLMQLTLNAACNDP